MEPTPEGSVFWAKEHCPWEKDGLLFDVLTFEREGDPDPVYVSRYAWKYGSLILNVTNGTLTVNHIDFEPDAINFDLYMAEILPRENPHKVHLVEFNPETKRYDIPCVTGDRRPKGM